MTRSARHFRSRSIRRRSRSGPVCPWLPSPIKLYDYAAGVVGNAMNGDLQRQKDIIRCEFGPACGRAVKGVDCD